MVHGFSSHEGTEKSLKGDYDQVITSPALHCMYMYNIAQPNFHLHCTCTPMICNAVCTVSKARPVCRVGFITACRCKYE